MRRSSSAVRFGRAFVAAGIAVATLGLLPWLALAVGAVGATSRSLLVLAGLAVIGGTYLALVGAGVLRQARAAARRRAEQALDAAVLDSTAGCGDSCTTCTASCALQGLRR